MSLKTKRPAAVRVPARRNVSLVRTPPPAPAHPDPLVSVVIPAMNEERTIAAVISGARAVHPRTEVIVVVNGSADRTAEVAASCGARVILLDRPLGHDVGRSIGAEAAKGGILLFTDGDLPLPARQLQPFVRAVERGVDIALNDYTGPVSRRVPHPVVLSKHTLNLLLGRSDLGGSSLTAVPHAISRRALAAIGSEALCSPPVAQAKAVLAGLRIEAVSHVPVGGMNAPRRKTRGTDPLSGVIVADHLRAIALLCEAKGSRAGFHDGGRRREWVP